MVIHHVTFASQDARNPVRMRVRADGKLEVVNDATHECHVVALKFETPFVSVTRDINCMWFVTTELWRRRWVAQDTWMQVHADGDVDVYALGWTHWNA